MFRDIIQHKCLSQKISDKLKTIFGFAGFIATLITFYTFLNVNKPSICLEILSNTNVVDVNSDVKLLDIIYKGRSLLKEGKNLRVVSLRVINNGEVDVLKNSFDDLDPCGFIIENGQLLEKPEIINASNDYLKKKTVINIDSSGGVYFLPIILDRKEGFDLKFFIIHESNKIPQIHSRGKIAGQKEIQVVDLSSNKTNRNFLDESIEGSFLIQITRILTYTVLPILLMLGVFPFLAMILLLKRRKKMRKQQIKLFKQSSEKDFTSSEKKLLDLYVNNELPLLEQMNYVISKQEEFFNIYKNKIFSNKAEEGTTKSNIIDGGIFTQVIQPYTDENVFEFMVENGLLMNTQERFIINNNLSEFLSKFLNFLYTDTLTKKLYLAKRKKS